MVLRSILLCLFICVAEILISQRHIHNVPEAMVSLQSDVDGSITALSHSGKLYRFNGADFILLQDGLKGARAISNRGGNYILTAKGGVWKWSGSKAKQQSLNEECYAYTSIDAKEYVLTQTGMHLFKEGRFQLINDWTTPIVRTAKFHHLNEMDYLSNNNSIYSYKSGKWKVLARDTVRINDLALCQDNIWVATDSGLRVMKNKTLKSILIDGLDSMKIDHLFALGKDLYIQGEGDLLKWNPKNSQTFKVDFKSSPSKVVQDQWGDIWFAEEGNIIQHKVGAVNISEPIISNINISVNGILQTSKDFVVNEEGSDLKINYEATHLREPKNITFQSLLSPLEKEYQSATSDRSIMYTDLPAGTYTYRLRSTVNGNHFSYSDPITIRVKAKNEVSPLWWVLGASCLFLLFLALLSNYRLQAYKEKSSLLTAKLRTSNDLIKSQQKTMQLKMNPHFLFNALNSIQGLVSLNRNDEAKKYIRTFSRMMRSVLDFSTVEKIGLQTEINYLEDYLSIEQMTRSNSFTYTINVDDALIEDDIKVPPMILQPFIENAIIHGVSSIKEGSITIEIKDEETYLNCIISDNGIGRKEASRKKASTHKSVAITLANERLQKLSKTKISDMIEYKDLLQGTEVIIKIPML